jgi:hypothetical protein
MKSAPNSARIGRNVELSEWLADPGDHWIDVPVVCVITRFGLRSPISFLPTFSDYRRVVREARGSRTPGLLTSALLVENPTTLYSMSIWRNAEAIPRFGTKVPIHAEAARRTFGRVSFDPGRGPELWATKWRLVSVSNNLNWDGFDLRQLILDQLGGDP